MPNGLDNTVGFSLRFNKDTLPPPHFASNAVGRMMGGWAKNPIFTALGHRECMVLDGGRIERRIHWEKVLQGLRRQAIGHQRGPLRLHEQQLGGDGVGQQRIQRPEGGGLATLAATIIESRTGEGRGAKEGAEGARVVFFDPERRSTVVTLSVGRNKGRRLLFYQMLLEPLEDGLRCGQREAQTLDPLV
jgi:hypothetical protein